MLFFRGPAFLPIEPLINRSPDLEQTALELIASYWSGARIPKELLINLLEKAGSKEAWEDLAWQGPKEARWVLTRYPELVRTNAMPFLYHISEDALPLLFNAEIGDTRQLHSATDHPMRIIDDWIKSGIPGEASTIKNRLTLIKAAKDWLMKGNDTAVGFQAVKTGYSPLFRDTITDPGAGNTVTLRSAYLLLPEMKALQEQWASFMEILKSPLKIDWPALRDIVHGWAYPEILGIKVSDDVHEFMLSFAQQILTDMSTLAQSHSGLLHWINQFSVDRGFDLRFEVDPEFEILYPVERKREFREHEEENRKRVQTLAMAWSKRDPQAIVEKILWIESEARIAGQNWPSWTNYLLSEISLLVDSPKAWAETLIKSNCLAEMLSPFLERTAEKLESGWVELLHICLQSEGYRGAAILTTLKHRKPPMKLIKEAIVLISGFSELVETLCLRKEIHDDKIVKGLLTHSDDKIASAAAQGIWFSTPKGEVPEAVVAEWSQAAIRSREEYFISEVMIIHPELAYDWLEGYIKEDPDDHFHHERAVYAAARVLDTEFRRKILQIILTKYHFSEVVYSIVGDDLHVYRDLIDNERLKMFHLVPLYWSDREIWVDKAKLALEVGYSPSEISFAVYGRGIPWSGKESNERKKWVDRFDKLCSYPDNGIRAIAEAGKAYAEQEMQDALRREKLEEIYGFRAYRSGRRR